MIWNLRLSSLDLTVSSKSFFDFSSIEYSGNENKDYFLLKQIGDLKCLSLYKFLTILYRFKGI